MDRGKEEPDREALDDLNARNIQRLDRDFKEIVTTATQVAVYSFTEYWSDAEAVGCLILYKRNESAGHGIVVINRIGLRHWDAVVSAEELEVEVSPPFLMFRGDYNRGIYCIWFYNQSECSAFADHFEGIGCSMVRNGNSGLLHLLPVAATVVPHPAKPISAEGAMLLQMLEGAEIKRKKRAQSGPDPAGESKPELPLDPFQVLLNNIGGIKPLSLTNEKVPSSATASSRNSSSNSPSNGSQSEVPECSSDFPNIFNRLFGLEATMQTVEQLERILAPPRPKGAIPPARLAQMRDNKTLEVMLKVNLGLASYSKEPSTDFDSSSLSSDESNLTGSQSSAKVSSLTPFLTPLESTEPSRAGSSARGGYTLDDIHGKTLDEVDPDMLYQVLETCQDGDLMLISKEMPGNAEAQLTWVRSKACEDRRLSQAAMSSVTQVGTALANCCVQRTPVPVPGALSKEELVRFIQLKLCSDPTFVNNLYATYSAEVLKSKEPNGDKN